jgi:hypothetical protein
MSLVWASVRQCHPKGNLKTRRATLLSMLQRLCGIGVAVVFAAVVAGCGSNGKSATELHVRLFTQDSTRNYRVRCHPDGGTVKNPSAVCAVIKRTPALLQVHSPGWDHSCPCCPPAVHVSGIAAKQKVAVTFAPCKTGQEKWAQRWTTLVGYTPHS